MLEREQFDLLHFHEPFVPFLSPIVLRLSTSVNVATFHAYGGFSPSYEFGRRVMGGYAEPAPRPDRGQRRGEALHRPLLPGRVQGHPERRRRRPLPAGRADRPLAGRHAQHPVRRPVRAAQGPARAAQGVPDPAQDRLRLPAARRRQRARSSREARRYVATRRLGGVEFLGRVSDEEKAQLFRTADVYVSPATGGESFGIVLLEAMAAGTRDRRVRHPRLQGRRPARPRGAPRRRRASRRPIAGRGRPAPARRRAPDRDGRGRARRGPRSSAGSG